MNELRRKYHKGINQDGSKSVSLKPESYALLKDKADELDVTIKSLLAAVIKKYIPSYTPDEEEKEGK